MSVKSFQINSIAQRIGLIVFGLICLVFLFFAARWYFGNSIALRAGYREVAEFALDLAPSDPQTHYAVALYNEKTFLPEDLQKSLAEYEQSAALAPNDYRVWLGLGKVRELSGDSAGAELALRKSLELAPNYAQVQWTFGNILLRDGKTEEAFAKIRRAAEGDVKFAAPAVSIAEQIFDGNLAQVKQNIGDSNQVKIALIVFLTNQKQFDEAFDVWNSISAEARKNEFRENGEQFLKTLLASGKYRAALQVQKQIFEAAEQSAESGKISNGGFETEVTAFNPGIFEWQIADGTNPQIGFDNAQKHGGKRSLVIIFNSLDGKEFRPLSQTIVVEPGKKYEFEFFYKSALKTSSTLKWEIVNASDKTVLATTNAISGETDWTNLKTGFTASSETEAVTLRLVRDKCPSSICPIAGKVWFDDFSLTAR